MADLNKDLKFEIDHKYQLALAELGLECSLRGLNLRTFYRDLRKLALEDCYGMASLPIAGDWTRKREARIYETLHELTAPQELPKVDEKKLEEALKYRCKEEEEIWFGLIDDLKAIYPKEAEYFIRLAKWSLRIMSVRNPQAYKAATFGYEERLKADDLLVEEAPVFVEELGVTERKLHLAYIQALKDEVQESERELNAAQKTLESYQLGKDVTKIDFWQIYAEIDDCPLESDDDLGLDDLGPLPKESFEDFLRIHYIEANRNKTLRVRDFIAEQEKKLEAREYRFKLK